MNIVCATVAFVALLSAAFVADASERCELDVVVNIDASSSLTPDQFNRVKAFTSDIVKHLHAPGNSVKAGVVSFWENNFETAVSLGSAGQGEVLGEITRLAQKPGLRPALMKSLQATSNFFKSRSEDRQSTTKVCVIVTAGEPSNIIGCLKTASQLRSSGAKIYVVALSVEGESEADVGGHHSSPNQKQRDFVNFLATIAGSPDGVHLLNPNSPKFLDRAADIANAICPHLSTSEDKQHHGHAVIEQPHHVEEKPVPPPAKVEEIVEQIVEELVDDFIPETTTEEPTRRPAILRRTTSTTTTTTTSTTEKPTPKPEPIEHRPPPPVFNENKPFRVYRTTTRPTTTSTTTLSPEDLQAIAFCQEVLNDVDVLSDQFFGNPDDCTSFFQCSLETGVLTAKLFSCQPGMFWKERLKQCMPGTTCKDRCEEPAIARRGVYADPTNCRRWFQCANSISYPSCCPIGTTYDDSLSTCITTVGCVDECDIGPAPSSSEEEPTAPTTAEPRFDANGCHDRWGGLKRPNRQNPAKYVVHIGKGHFVPMACPMGTRFDLIECDCVQGDAGDFAGFEGAGASEETEEIHCLLYLPFDEGFNDLSNHRLWATPVVFGGAWIDQRVRVFGEGSARISSSGVACPGLAGADFRDHITIAMWIKCYSASAVCHGDLFANGNTRAAPTVRISLREQNNEGAKATDVELSLLVNSVDEPVTLAYTLTRPWTLAWWSHLALRYDGYALSLFINGTLIDEIPCTGNIGVSMTQIVVAGAVTTSNQFRGYVDEVIVLPVALDDVGMRGLLKADMGRLAHDGWIKV